MIDGEDAELLASGSYDAHFACADTAVGSLVAGDSDDEILLKGFESRGNILIGPPKSSRAGPVVRGDANDRWGLAAGPRSVVFLVVL